MTERGSSQPSNGTPKCLNVVSWRAATPKELLEFLEQRRKRTEAEREQNRPSALAVRHHITPVDMYCYLKARFGEPNGFQNILRADDSDNLFHWDFSLRADDEDVYISGMSREVHLVVSATMTDEDWRDLILAIKGDYKRVGREKSAVLKSLEQWVIFPNRYVEIAAVCADLHATIVDNVGGFQVYKTPSGALREQETILKRLGERASILHRSCLQLSLLTPVLAEAFINMVILMLCKPDIRDNRRQLDTFIRSQIDTKLFDLAYKCEGFVRPIDQHSETFKNFKRVMDKRNHTIHGNCDPEREQIERIYFEGTRPLFSEPGDHIGKFFEALERQYQPEAVIKDYEDVHEFLADLMTYLDPRLVKSFRRIMEDRYPGYDIGRKKMGALFPEHYVVCNLEGVRYDDELSVMWTR